VLTQAIVFHSSFLS